MDSANQIDWLRSELRKSHSKRQLKRCIERCDQSAKKYLQEKRKLERQIDGINRIVSSIQTIRVKADSGLRRAIK